MCTLLCLCCAADVKFTDIHKLKLYLTLNLYHNMHTSIITNQFYCSYHHYIQYYKLGIYRVLTSIFYAQFYTTWTHTRSKMFWGYCSMCNATLSLRTMMSRSLVLSALHPMCPWLFYVHIIPPSPPYATHISKGFIQPSSRIKNIYELSCFVHSESIIYHLQLIAFNVDDFTWKYESQIINLSQ